MTDIERSMQVLKGLLRGIAAEARVTEDTVFVLQQWMDQHRDLTGFWPFAEVTEWLQRIIDEEAVDQREAQAFLNYCVRFDVPGEHFDFMTTAVLELHGRLSAMAADADLTAQEIADLKEWVNDVLDVRHQWPFDELVILLDHITASGKIAEQHHHDLVAFCQNVAEWQSVTQRQSEETGEAFEEAYEKYAQAKRQVAKTIGMFSGQADAISFTDKTFCFTGKVRSGKRSTLAAQAEAKGAKVAKRLNDDVDFLVVGANTNPAWAYSAYKEMIDQAITMSETGHRIRVVHEDDFLQAAES